MNFYPPVAIRITASPSSKGCLVVAAPFFLNYYLFFKTNKLSFFLKKKGLNIKHCTFCQSRAKFTENTTQNLKKKTNHAFSQLRTTRKCFFFSSVQKVKNPRGFLYSQLDSLFKHTQVINFFFNNNETWRTKHYKTPFW